MKRLSDIDPDVLRAGIEILSEKNRAPIVDATSLATEQARLELAFQSGRYRVIQDLIDALKPQKKPTTPNDRTV